MSRVGFLVASHLAVAGGVYAVTDRRPVDIEARHTGYFTVESTKALTATVESLRDEAELTVLSYKGTAKVETRREWLWVFHGRQELSVPAAVSYQIDLSKITLADVSYNETAKIVTVRLPRVTVGEIAFQPENASTVNGGVLTYSEVSCPLLSGPSTMTVWTEEGTRNACEEAQARGDHRQAA